jgi:hypothetical protein
VEQRMNKGVLALAAWSAALVTTSAANATQRADKIAITPGSPKGAIILKAPRLTPPPTFASAYKLSIMGYDPATGVMKGSWLGGALLLEAKPKLNYGGYLVADIDPGTYVIGDFSHQDWWALCFNGGSKAFTIRPGEVLYLGELDAEAELAELMELTLKSGRISVRQGNVVHFFDTVTPPRLAPIDDAQLQSVATEMKTILPKTTVAPKAAVLRDAKFGTGSDLFGLQRVCGGYYRKGVKKD